MKEKILNLLLTILLTFLIISFFFWEKTQEQTKQGLNFSLEKTTYSVPANILFHAENNTSETIEFNTCENINISFAWERLILWEDFCKDISLASWEKKDISLGDNYKLFETTWAYTFEIFIEEKKYIYQVEIKNKWTLAKIFVYIFYAPIYNIMVFFVKHLSYSLGWSIIWITILIRILLLYPQHKMLVSQRKMQKIQPKIKALQEKHKGDNQALGMAMMELYKKEQVNPMGSCGLLLIQMPILLVLYRVVMGVENPINYYYIYGFLLPFSISDIMTNFYWMDLLGKWGIVWIVLGVFVGTIQFIQIKLSLTFNNKNKEKKAVIKKKSDDPMASIMPDPEMMNKFMLFGMPVMVWFFTYSLYAWIGLYWWISTLFGIFQQLFVNKIIKK